MKILLALLLLFFDTPDLPRDYCNVGVPTLEGSFGPGFSPGVYKFTLSPGTVGGKWTGYLLVDL